MATDPDTDVTRLLKEVAAGDRRQLDPLFEAVYARLRDIAGRHMARERRSHTLQPTDLVNEAYLKLIDQRDVTWQDRAHFFSIASTIMRRILVDHERRRRREKHGGGQRVAMIETLVDAPDRAAVDLVALDDALARLADRSPQQVGIVEMRYFGGLTIEQIAEVLGIGKRSVDREWSYAKAWLARALAGDDRRDA